MARKRSIFPLLLIVVLSAMAFTGWKLLGPSVRAKKYLYVATGGTYISLLDSLAKGDYVSDLWSFDLAAQALKLPARLHPGRYQLTKGMSNLSLIRMLRNGSQAEVKLVLNKVRTKQDFIRLLDANLEADSTTLALYMLDTALLDYYGVDTATFMTVVLPNTYLFYWNNTPRKVLDKIYHNYVSFWTPQRKQLAKDKNLTQAQATIIASIVEEETNVAADKPAIASVYMNRLNRGMKLQADPTVKFSIGDFTIKRVTGEMLKTPSAYNTYYSAGLPPGPICTPSQSTIDAVLNAPETGYLYFCAKDDLSGASVFAANGEEHMKNARAYQKALNSRGIH